MYHHNKGFHNKGFHPNRGKGITILGKGGHADAIVDIIESFRTYSISCGGKVFVESQVEWDKDTEVIKGERYIVGFGDLNNINNRQKCYNYMIRHGGNMVTLISPYAIVSPTAKIGKGVVVMPRAFIGPKAIIGNNCIINTGAIIEHGVRIGTNTHVCPGAVVNGGCIIGDDVLIGSNATIKHGIKIWHNNIIGAGAVVVKNIAGTSKTFIGVPAIEK